MIYVSLVTGFLDNGASYKKGSGECIAKADCD